VARRPFVITSFAALCLAASSFAHADCYESSVTSPTPFMGNDGEVVKLADGSLWQIKYEYEYMYEYYPDVIVCPDQGKLGVKGKMLNAQPLKSAPVVSAQDPPAAKTPEVVESRIEGDFEGWEGDTIFKLDNGQVWQQTDGRYKYKYKYRPRVVIVKSGRSYLMQVEGVDDRIRVEQLK
jgi:hypothetical protein